MDFKTLTSYLYLLASDGIGVLSARRLLDVYGDVNRIFEPGSPVEKEMLPLLQMIRSSAAKPENREIIKKEIRFIEQHGIRCTGILDSDYPSLLRQCPDAPILLFYKGNLDVLNKPALSVVGTRKMTDYGKEMVKRLVHHIQLFNPVVVSGMAHGVDIEVYREARRKGLPVVGVMGTGFQVLYPGAYRKYYEDLFCNGLVITEYASFNTLSPELFVRRNRIVAGLAQATVVIESAERGGSLSTAFFARDYGREVYAVPGKVTDEMSKGCLRLIQENKAQLLSDFDLFANDLNWKPAFKIIPEPAVKQPGLNNLTETEQKIISSLIHPVHIDDLALETGMDMPVLNSELLLLELKGLIKSLPGKMFRRT